jgi:hypothetical protein
LAVVEVVVGGVDDVHTRFSSIFGNFGLPMRTV